MPAGVLARHLALNVADLGTTEPVSVDASGRFLIPLPPGRWTVNGVKVIADGRTASDWWLRTGADPSLDVSKPYMPWTTRTEGLSISIATTVPDEPHITLDLKRRLDLEMDGVDVGTTPPRAGDSARLTWQRQPDVARYQIVRWDHERYADGRARSSPVCGIVVGDSTAFDLSTLPMVPANSANGTPPVYSAEIFGFDDQGRLVAQGCDGRFSDAPQPFQLPGGKALSPVDDAQPSGSEADLDALLARLEASTKLDAVEVLLDEQLPK